METWEKIDISKSNARALLPLKHGGSGVLVSTGAWLSGPVPLLFRISSVFLPERKLALRRLAACAGIVGSLFTRYGWVQAGKSSARDWRLALEIEAPKEVPVPTRAKRPTSRAIAKAAGAICVMATAFFVLRRKF